MISILLIEDDAALSRLLEGHLKRYGYDVILPDPEDFRHLDQLLLKFKPHLILLDIELPFYDGYVWARKFREQSTVPIMFISARGEPIDQVRALENGGDDYVVKPFHMEVLLAKIEALLRRTYELSPIRDETERTIQAYGELILDLKRLLVQYRDQKTTLTPVETSLLHALIKARGSVVDRDQLMLAAWDEVMFVDDNTLTVNISRLRQKLAQLGLFHVLETVRGQGYRLKQPDTSA
ncbi:MAG: response regulator transcription factor [Candidatus Carbobacillus sp.]|nr:response regulator transcription factor [Candidatus Carbobacillus sp.]